MKTSLFFRHPSYILDAHVVSPVVSFTLTGSFGVLPFSPFCFDESPVWVPRSFDDPSKVLQLFSLCFRDDRDHFWVFYLKEEQQLCMIPKV